MLINGIELSTYHATLSSKDIQTADIITYDDWLRKAPNPLYIGTKEMFKNIKLRFIIEDTDEQACMMDISNLVTALKKCTIKFDDLDFFYDCTISTKDSKPLVEKGYYELNVDLKAGYGYTGEVTIAMNNIASKTFTVAGNLSSPASITLTASINTSSVTINGFGEEITIKNLLANVPVVIDGETCTIIQNGSNKFADADLWGFPILIPGSTTITINNLNCATSIKYKPKYV